MIQFEQQSFASSETVCTMDTKCNHYFSLFITIFLLLLHPLGCLDAHDSALIVSYLKRQFFVPSSKLVLNVSSVFGPIYGLDYKLFSFKFMNTLPDKG